MEETTHTPKKSPAKRLSPPTKPLLLAAGAIVVIGASFYSGVAYQKSKQPVAKDTGFTTNADGTGFRHRSMMRSEVTAISSSSITIKDLQGVTKTYSINSSTQIVKDGQSATYSDIAVGDNVVVISTDGTSASRIMDGMMGGGFSTGGPGIDQGQLQTN